MRLKLADNSTYAEAYARASADYLKMAGARLFEDLHVSGHAFREDHYEFISLLNPQHIIPAHGNVRMTASYAEFSGELGYTLGNDVHLMQNGQRLKLN